MLRVLSESHARELYELAPRLIGALSMICGPDEQNTADRGAAFQFEESTDESANHPPYAISRSIAESGCFQASLFGIGVCATALAVLLLRCIALSTNLFYYHRFSLAPVSPAGSPLGYWMLIVPGNRRTSRRADGPVRLGQDSRTVGSPRPSKQFCFTVQR